MYYLHILNNKIDCCGNKILNIEGYISIEINEEIYYDYVQYPNKYTYINGEVSVDPNFEEQRQADELARINALTLDSSTFFKEVLRTSGKTSTDIQTLVQSNITLTTFQKENILIDLQKSSTLTRGSYFVVTLGALLNYTVEQLNYLFKHGVFNL